MIDSTVKRENGVVLGDGELQVGFPRLKTNEILVEVIPCVFRSIGEGISDFGFATGDINGIFAFEVELKSDTRVPKSSFRVPSKHISF